MSGASAHTFKPRRVGVGASTIRAQGEPSCIRHCSSASRPRSYVFLPLPRRTLAGWERVQARIDNVSGRLPAVRVKEDDKRKNRTAGAPLHPKRFVYQATRPWKSMGWTLLLDVCVDASPNCSLLESWRGLRRSGTIPSRCLGVGKAREPVICRPLRGVLSI